MAEPCSEKLVQEMMLENYQSLVSLGEDLFPLYNSELPSGTLYFF